MALARRLSRVERDLDVEGHILRWLTEAHGFDSMEAYARWTTEQPDALDPFARLLDRVEATARKAQGKAPPLDVQRAVKAARRQARFAAFLVVQLNSEAEDRLVRLGLSQLALMFWLRELTLRDALVEHGEAVAELAHAEGLYRSWGHWREAATSLLLGLYEAHCATERLEDRYLSGHGSLFPATVDSWRELADRTEGLYEVAQTLREGEAFETLETLRQRATGSAEAIVERLVRMASVETYRAIGERDKADAAVKALMERVTMP